jgi:hypothetical protein
MFKLEKLKDKLEGRMSISVSDRGLYKREVGRLC